MAKKTGILWTDHTFNPWWGCQKVSEGCRHCYAETLSGRWGGDFWGGAQRRTFGEDHWREPRAWSDQAQEAGERRRVFCASMGDVFEDLRTLDRWRKKLWPVIDGTPWLDWLLLTKRPENVLRLGPKSFARNVWLGVTVENQAAADRRMPILKGLDASVRFLSVEPLLGPVKLDLRGIHWVIVGGESGSHLFQDEDKRGLAAYSDGKWAPTDEAVTWVRSIRDQCSRAGVAFFFKQWGGASPHATGRLLDGRIWEGLPETSDVPISMQATFDFASA